MQQLFKSRHRFFRWFTLIVTGIATMPGYAQQSPVTRADEVVVTATRFTERLQELPVGVTVINQAQIRDSTAATAPELLMQLAGVQVRDNSGSSNPQVDLRGFGITGDQNTLVLLDGQRISENEQATVNWAAIPLAAIERIEIMRGSGAVLYGAGATGGAINIITKTPQRGRKSITLGAGFGDYATGDYRAGLNLAGENLGIAASASRIETDNYRIGNRLRQQSAQADVRFTRGSGTLYAKFGASDQDLQLPGSLTEAQIAVNRRPAATPGDFSHTSGGYLNLGGELRLGGAELAMNAGYRGKNANSSYFVATPFRNNIHTQVTAVSLTPRARIPFTLGGMNHTLVAGIDWDEWDFDSTSGPSVIGHPLALQRNTAWYLQDTVALGAATTLSLGARAQRVKYSVNDALSGAAVARSRNLSAFEIAARHKIDDVLSVYGKFGNSFRVPNVNDLYNLFTASITVLEPQTSHDREIGVELRLARARYRAALYHLDLSNEIHLDPIAFNNINLPPTRRYGMELEGHWTLATGLSAFANYTHARAEFRAGEFGGLSVAGREVPLVPRHSANLGAAWEFMPRARLNAVARYVGSQVFDSDETNTFGRRMPGYLLVDIKLTRETAGWLLSAGVRNLLNRKYFTYGVYTGFPTFNAYPAAERSLFVSAQYSFND